jgi:hypothetical protein
MTISQKETVRRLLEEMEPSGVAHGDCIGADMEFHNIALQLGKWIRIHPPIKGAKRAHCKEWNEIMPAKDYLVRNQDIVNGVDYLIACPEQDEEIVRSGTWSTVRYARRKGVPVILVLPSGKVAVEP